MLNVEIRSETKMKRSENKMKKKQKLPSFSLRSETEAKLFSLLSEKSVFFRLFSHLKQNENEMKRKQNEKEAKTLMRKRIK
jgi:hypothetical protein